MTAYWNCELDPSDTFNRNQLLGREELVREKLSAARPVTADPRVLQVLMVGDDRAAADELAQHVDRWGHSVRLAYDAVSALQAAAVQQPDVVLLDVSLPLEDGCQFVEQLRVELPPAKTFIITAVAQRPDAEHFEQTCAAGIDVLLVKPVDPSVMETLLMLARRWIVRKDKAPSTKAERSLNRRFHG